MRTLNGSEELVAAEGTDLGVSEWVSINQDEVGQFADLTGDHQWIHLDVERARESPFGSTIVHGFFTLALLPRLLANVYQITGFDFGVNYGLNRVRFPSPVPVGSKLRASAKLTKVEPVTGGLQVTVECAIQREGSAKPVCVADMLARVYAAAS